MKHSQVAHRPLLPRDSLKQGVGGEKVRQAMAERLGLRNFYCNPESYLNFFVFQERRKMRKKRKDEKMAGEKKKALVSVRGSLAAQFQPEIS